MHSCPVCGFEYSTVGGLNQHLAVKHPPVSLQSASVKIQRQLEETQRQLEQANASLLAERRARELAQQALRDIKRIAQQGDVNVQPLLLDTVSEGLGGPNG